MTTPRTLLPAALALALAPSLMAGPAKAETDGLMLAQACAGCHGQSGEGMGAIPDIRGIASADFIRLWEEFRADERAATIMNRIARGYSEAEVAALAAYFETLD